MVITRKEFATLLKDFLSGSIGPFDFDDAMSVKIDDKLIESFRREIIGLRLTHQSDDGAYTSPVGVSIIQEIISTLELS